ncbi:MAG: UvrD-helicase domain-containing protein, partial [Pseudonocardiaceae bacterium]
IWTPWFAVLGSKSGFDAIEDCYVDLPDHIFALETGLSSDPAMNWRISGLDRYRLVSNSDAHSPPMLGREATVFETDLDYFAIRRALETGAGHVGSVEFFPEEGKYHVDGHRKCGIRMEPQETREHGGICPGCGKPLTVGVLSRVEELADRPAGIQPFGAAGFRSLVPLPEIMSEILGTGPKSKKVLGQIDRLTAALGPELVILQDVPLDDIEVHSPLLAEAVARLRSGAVTREAGYDGEYGVIRLFEPGELKRISTVTAPALFDDALFDTSQPLSTALKRKAAVRFEPAPPAETESPLAETESPQQMPVRATGSLLDGLDPEQRAAAEIREGPLLIIAGPGTGKTRTLTHRIAHLVTAHGVAPQHCLAITFTRRAAEEMAVRLTALAPEQAPKLTIATFHSLGVRILREEHERVELSPNFGIADRTQQMAIVTELTGDDKKARHLLTDLSRQRRTGELEIEFAEAADRYTKALRQRDLVDFDDLVALPVTLLESDPDLAVAYRDRYRWISVDEYQDVDEQQYRLLSQLASPQGNLTAIGDPDQAIYRFRGADVGFFLRFQQDFPGARTVALTRNYRSGAKILTAALQVISPTTLVPDRTLRPMGARPNSLVGMHQALTEQAEASFVTHMIEQLLGGVSFHSLDSGRVDSDGTGPLGLGGLGFSDFAVLYRTDRQARAVMDALTRAGLPVQKRSHDRLADRPGVERILGELMYVPASGAEGTPVLERLGHAASAVLNRVPAAERDDTAAEIYAAVELLQPLAGRCGDDLERFRTELSLGVEVDSWDPRADRVSLLTLHAAKGLEFPVVFVVGCEDGLLPLRWPGMAPGDADEEQVREERRLLFVGMTRAQRHLYLSHAAQRVRHGTARKTSPSPFLADLDAAGCEQIGDILPRPKPRDVQLRLL